MVAAAQRLLMEVKENVVSEKIDAKTINITFRRGGDKTYWKR
jgi:hypothetical protein